MLRMLLPTHSPEDFPSPPPLYFSMPLFHFLFISAQTYILWDSFSHHESIFYYNILNTILMCGVLFKKNKILVPRILKNIPLVREKVDNWRDTLLATVQVVVLATLA